MSRQLTGRKNQIATGWEASLPEARGAKKRIRHVFTTEAAADLWLAAAKADLENGHALTVPAADDLADTGRRKTSLGGTAFRPLGEKWAVERYEELWRGGLGRETTVKAHVARISNWMEQHGLTFETMVREEVKAFQRSLTRRDQETDRAIVPAGLDPKALLSIKAALALPEMTASLSTLKRRINEGVLVSASKSQSGHLYTVADLFSDDVLRTSEGGLKRGPRRQGSLSQEVVSDIMWVFNQVCLFAEDHGVAVPQDRSSLAIHRTDKAASAPRQPLDLAQTGRIAGRLHAVHQIALWLMRVLGLRISEAYGILVEDFIDNGPALPGIVVIKAQGGRIFHWRDIGTGRIEVADRSDELKTLNSYRVLVVPPMLMNLLRTAIEIFHTSPDGTVVTSARLIPGLGKRDGGGQASFRAALAAAAAAEGIDCTTGEEGLDDTFSCTPHDMRRSVISELDQDKKVKVSHAKRFAGHAAGVDVHHRYYVLDDPKLKAMRKIAEKIEKSLVAEVPAGLLVPTAVRCTTGSQRELAADAARIDAVLAELGWLVTAADADNNPLLTAEQVALELGVTSKTAREWMREGFVPSIVWADRARGQERRSRLCDVLALQSDLRSLTTIRGLAAEVNQPYHTVYQYIRAQKIDRRQHGERGFVIDEAAATRVRAHYAEQAALHERALPLSVAAADLEVTPAIVLGMVNDGLLVLDDRAHDGRRMVTRESVAAVRQQREKQSAHRDRGPRTDLVTWQDARSATGLSDAQVDALVAECVFVQVQHQRRRHLTRASVLTYLVEHAPERLLVLGVV